MIKKIIKKYKSDGLANFLKSIYNCLRPIKAKSISLINEIISSGNGLEIGGFSPVFDRRGIVPIYENIQSLDNCNFSSNTVWEGEINRGNTYLYSKKHNPGKQHVLEATDLYKITNESYDFLLSSHVIEHTANPIRALNEWIRVVKKNGHLILLIPHMDGTFDHRRPVTTIEHLIADYKGDTTEKDLTHLEEILELHDLTMDQKAGTAQEFLERSKCNDENRCLHHHVFNSHLAVELINFLNLKIVSVEAIAPMHILIVAQKPLDGVISDNQLFFDLVRSSKYLSPFSSDKT